jgi:hypothetical protein
LANGNLQFVIGNRDDSRGNRRRTPQLGQLQIANCQLPIADRRLSSNLNRKILRSLAIGNLQFLIGNLDPTRQRPFVLAWAHYPRSS